MIPEAHDLGERAAVVPRRFDAANLTHRAGGPSDSMTRPMSCTTRPRFSSTRVSRALKRLREPMARTEVVWVNGMRR